MPADWAGRDPAMTVRWGLTRAYLKQASTVVTRVADRPSETFEKPSSVQLLVVRAAWICLVLQ